MVLAAGLFAAPATDASGSGGCATRIGEILIGTGEAGTDIAALNLVNHWDVPFPLSGCSNGAFYIDAGKSGLVSARTICDQDIVRVWAAAGSLAQDFTIHFVAGGC